MTGDEQQAIFQYWLSQYKALIFKVVRAYATTPPDRDDLFQEISIQLWHSIPSFRGDSATATWLYRVSLNTAIKWVKKERKHNSADMPEQVPHILQETPLAQNEKLEWLYDQINLLDKIDRSLILLLLDGFSYKEMASILGISESNVGVKINRIKKQLITHSKNIHHGI
ncbi:MAG: RNA polymerase sigma factor [Bacteroidetes bacterium]|nr:RNA polymerase sigma factor [Bacteroidota bacterium]